MRQKIFLIILSFILLFLVSCLNYKDNELIIERQNIINQQNDLCIFLDDILFDSDSVEIHIIDEEMNEIILNREGSTPKEANYKLINLKINSLVTDKPFKYSIRNYEAIKNYDGNYLVTNLTISNTSFAFPINCQSENINYIYISKIKTKSYNCEFLGDVIKEELSYDELKKYSCDKIIKNYELVI